MSTSTLAPDWILTTNPDSTSDTALLLTEGETSSSEKTRAFQVSLVGYVCAPGFQQPRTPTQETVYPIWITLAGPAAAYRTVRANFRLGAYGRLHPLGQAPHRGHLRVDLGPPTAYRWAPPQHIVDPSTHTADVVFTAYLPALFDIVPPPGDDATIRFCCCLAPWHQAALLAELQQDAPLCRAILDHAAALGLLGSARRGQPWPADAPHWTPDDLLALVPGALYSLDYLQQRTFRPIPQSAAFRLQFYLWACRQGLFTHAHPLPMDAPDRLRQAWQDPQAPHPPDGPDDPWSWAQHPGPLGLTLHTPLPPEARPVVLACQINAPDLDAFLLEQVALYYRLHRS
jgi:hypothetical protein